MYFIYNIFVSIIGFLLKPIARINKKIALFLNGRKETFDKLSQISKEDKVIWIHAASLGEFEQGRPIIEALKKDSKYKKHKIVLTFFSPSGYEIRKDYKFADVVCYLPIDTKSNVKKFLNLVHPKIAVFVKYEFWPNLLNELNKRKTPSIVISAIFRDNQMFFKPNFIGRFLRNSLKGITHFFVQDNTSEKLLNQIGFNNVTVCSDTRFDRVYNIVNQNNKIEKVERFIFGFSGLIFVAGSTWQKDEDLLVDYINNYANPDEKYIIAPHLMNKDNLHKLKERFNCKAQFYSDNNINNDLQVLIIDTIGILNKLYSYASAAYVGGGLGVGIHNILEPATFGVPIIIGPNHQKFKEAIDLVNLNACFVISDKQSFTKTIQKLKDNNEREKAGNNAKKYVFGNLGGTQCILKNIKQIID
jgi:3-deoxy-D-manno-octulosonic-acid transferase